MKDDDEKQLISRKKTKYNVKKEKNTKFLLKNNIVFRSLILGVAAIAVWRGLWTLQDLYLFPKEPVLSCIISILIGIIIFYIYSEIQL
tara:strand:- start:1737 stop:2000 length:264 start_codon:yes stop_codon:yes gene_type:complete